VDEIKTPIIDREIKKRISQTKRAYTILENKQKELLEADSERLSNLMKEKERLAIRAVKAWDKTNKFIRDVNGLWEWER
jgi:hypothetical protein